jgi:hypothetical protein
VTPNCVPNTFKKSGNLALLDKKICLGAPVGHTNNPRRKPNVTASAAAVATLRKSFGCRMKVNQEDGHSGA